MAIDFPQNAKWLATFLDWWTLGLQQWRARSGPDATAVFLCELGPPEYAITDANGDELSDRRAEALTIRRLVRERWKGWRSLFESRSTAHTPSLRGAKRRGNPAEKGRFGSAGYVPLITCCISGTKLPSPDRLDSFADARNDGVCWIPGAHHTSPHRPSGSGMPVSFDWRKCFRMICVRRWAAAVWRADFFSKR